MNDPRVTVIIPVYNGQRYIAEAIESVLAQTVPVHLIVVNDGSTDGTVVKAIAAGLSLYCLIRIPQNKGAAFALNVGIIAGSASEFVAWLSHDDVFHPAKIERQLEAIGGADACYTNFDIIDADGALVEHVAVKPPPPEGMFRQIIVRNIINGSSMMIRRDVFERVGFFREDLRVDVDGAHDTDLVAIAQAADDVPAPPAEADERRIDHVTPCLCRRRVPAFTFHAGRCRHRR